MGNDLESFQITGIGIGYDLPQKEGESIWHNSINWRYTDLQHDIIELYEWWDEKEQKYLRMATHKYHVNGKFTFNDIEKQNPNFTEYAKSNIPISPFLGVIDLSKITSNVEKLKETYTQKIDTVGHEIVDLKEKQLQLVSNFDASFKKYKTDQEDSQKTILQLKTNADSNFHDIQAQVEDQENIITNIAVDMNQGINAIKDEMKSIQQTVINDKQSLEQENKAILTTITQYIVVQETKQNNLAQEIQTVKSDFGKFLDWTQEQEVKRYDKETDHEHKQYLFYKILIGIGLCALLINAIFIGLRII